MKIKWNSITAFITGHIFLSSFQEDALFKSPLSVSFLDMMFISDTIISDCREGKPANSFLQSHALETEAIFSLTNLRAFCFNLGAEYISLRINNSIEVSESKVSRNTSWQLIL